VGVGGRSKTEAVVSGPSFTLTSVIPSSSSSSTSSSMEANCSIGAGAGGGGGANWGCGCGEAGCGCGAGAGAALCGCDCGGGGGAKAGPVFARGRAALKSIEAADVTMLTVMPSPPSSLLSSLSISLS
jgi:hypothetical protein